MAESFADLQAAFLERLLVLTQKGKLAWDDDFSASLPGDGESFAALERNKSYIDVCIDGYHQHLTPTPELVTAIEEGVKRSEQDRDSVALRKALKFLTEVD